MTNANNQNKDNLARKLDTLEMLFLRYMDTTEDPDDLDGMDLAKSYVELRNDVVLAHNVVPVSENTNPGLEGVNLISYEELDRIPIGQMQGNNTFRRVRVDETTLGYEKGQAVAFLCVLYGPKPSGSHFHDVDQLFFLKDGPLKEHLTGMVYSDNFLVKARVPHNVGSKMDVGAGFMMICEAPGYRNDHSNV